jgi:hypothetical protein
MPSLVTVWRRSYSIIKSLIDMLPPLLIYMVRSCSGTALKDIGQTMAMSTTTAEAVIFAVENL